MTKDRAVHRRQPLRVVVVEGIMKEGMDDLYPDITPTSNKKRITVFLGADRQWKYAMLNVLLHSNDYEGRRVTRCFEVLPTTLHSTPNTSSAAKPWKDNLQSAFTF
ncbi:hypothetical protein TNCV_3147801 [Trichonephila clavipes]|nr:hypothetical protein TNCV_3147801 [Trichonephila clavipes]